MGFEYYEGPGEIQFNGSTLAEATSIKIRYSSNAADSITMTKGWAGIARGPAMAEISVTNVVPKIGMENDYIDMCMTGAKCDIVVPFGAKRRAHQAVIKDVETSQTAEGIATADFTAKSGPPRVL